MQNILLHMSLSRRRLLCAAPFALAGAIAMLTQARAASFEPTPQAVSWLLAQQNSDGGFGGKEGASDTENTAQVLIALAAAPSGLGGLSWRARKTPIQFLEQQARANKPGSAVPALWVQAIAASGRDPAKFGGKNFVNQVNVTFVPSTGLFGSDRRGHAQAILALRRAGQTPPDSALDALSALQRADGGWSIDAQTSSDPASTAQAMRALKTRVFAVDQPQTLKAVNYLKAVQNPDGGFARAWRRGPSNAVSTAQVLQTLRTLNTGPEVLSASNGNPLTALATMRAADGSFQLSPGQASDLLGTAFVVLALNAG